MNRGTILLLATSVVQLVMPLPAQADWYLASHTEDFGGRFAVELAKPCEKAPSSPADIYETFRSGGARLLDEGDKGILVIFNSPTGGYVATEHFFHTVEACKAFLAQAQQESLDRQREREKALAPYR